MIDFKRFPTTRYQGSKRKILPWIYDCIKDLEFETVIDAFGGSASFSFLVKKMGKSVIYNDLMKFNYLIGKSLIENQSVVVTPEELEFVCNNNCVGSDYNFIQQNFSDIYYLDEENEWLDNIIYNINNLPGDTNLVEHKKAILFNALFQSSLVKRPFNLFHRKNLNLRTADVKRNFGNKVTWEKTFENHFLRFVKEINESVFNNDKRCLALNNTVLDLEVDGVDCVYLDPPYFKSNSKNETSNYYQCYHFLEGIANYSNWGLLINDDLANKGFNSNSSQQHFNKVSLEESFEELFLKFQNKTIILSYKSGGHPSIEFLEGQLRKMGKRVVTNTTNHSYALNKDGKKGIPSIEALIIAK